MTKRRRHLRTVLGLAVLLHFVGCKVNADTASPQSSNARAEIDESCRGESIERCRTLENEFAMQLYECNKLPAGSSGYSPGCRRERAKLEAVRQKLQQLQAQRAAHESENSVSVAQDAAATRTPSPVVTQAPMRAPPSDEDVAAAVATTIETASASCGGVARRVLVSARIALRTTGTPAATEIDKSTLPSKATVACLDAALKGLGTAPYDMPPGKGMETECPAGTAGANMFKCRQVQRDYLRYDVSLVVEPNGKVERLSFVPTEEINLVVQGKDVPLVGHKGVEGSVVSRRSWPTEPGSNAPRFCVEAVDKRVGSPMGGAAGGGNGWCFVIACDGTEDGHVGLSGPMGDPICPASAKK